MNIKIRFQTVYNFKQTKLDTVELVLISKTKFNPEVRLYSPKLIITMFRTRLINLVCVSF